ncbi:MAG TPA: glycosyltransferase 87 family protein [Burkholderiales bacterium]
MRRPAALTVFGVCAATCAVWTVLAGKDLNYDLLNYHYYVAYELLGGRLAQDFYAASAQSYLNPLGYLPFYALASSWHSVLASIVLAIAASASLALLYLLAWRLFAHRSARERLAFALLGTALGAATAVFWPMVGTSILDPWLAALVLGGVLLLLGEPVHGRRALAAGALIGAAAALKYSNAVYGVAALVLLFGRPWRAALGYAVGGAAAVALLAGPWFVLLLREFGNPVFPLFNAWFKSPFAPPVNQIGGRFTPDGLLEALTLPLRMATTSSRVYLETAAPDIRFAALVAAAVALPILGRRVQQSRLAATDWRLLAFFFAAAVLWIATSSNGRYGVPLLLLCGVVLARLVERLLPAGPARVALALLLGVQLAMCLTASPSRWFAAEPWSSRWLPYEVPPRAAREPALYLSVETLPMAVVAPFLPASASFVNLRGHHSVPPDSPRLAALIEAQRGRLRTLGRELRIDAYDATFRRIGYRVDSGDCFTIAWRPQRDDLLSRWANALARRAPSPEPLSVLSCALVPAPRDPAREAEARHVSALFDRIEQACPALFRGQTAVTDALVNGWARLYNGLDARLELRGEHLVFNRYYDGSSVDLGTLADWAGAGAPPCGRM